MWLRGPIYCLLALGLLTSSVSYAAEYYRYTDERGIIVINRQGIPSHIIGNGYEVLNEQGRVVRVIPRAPTPAEYRKMQADEMQEKSDRQLLRLYSRLEDIDRARERKISNIDGQIIMAQNNLLLTNKAKASLQSQAAAQERAGLEVSSLLLKQMEDASGDQQRLQQQIEHYMQSKTTVESVFARDRQRLVELLKRK